MANYIAKENIISGDLERAQSTHAVVQTAHDMSKHRQRPRTNNASPNSLPVHIKIMFNIFPLIELRGALA